MQVINFVSNMAMPMMILLIVIYGVIEKNKIFDTFLDGAKDGIQIVLSIFPTLVGLFVAIGALRSSGIIDLIVHLITPILNVIKFPNEIMPLAMLRPISGSSSVAIATDIMKNYGEYQVVTKSNEEYLKILKGIGETKDLVLYITDLLNLEKIT